VLDEENYDDHFKLHVEERQCKLLIAHGVMSTKSITEIKGDPITLENVDVMYQVVVVCEHSFNMSCSQYSVHFCVYTQIGRLSQLHEV
jgi:hypothetical protein